MKKRIIRLTEQDLHNIIKESVNNILLEWMDYEDYEYIFKYGSELGDFCRKIYSYEDWLEDMESLIGSNFTNGNYEQDYNDIIVNFINDLYDNELSISIDELLNSNDVEYELKCAIRDYVESDALSY